MQSFYAEVRKTNVDEYEPNSLASMQAGIDRYLKENNYHVSIIRDRVFSKSRAVLEGKCKNLREHGKSKRPNKSNRLSESEVNVLCECGQLGTHSPLSLINTIWWLFTLQFGLRRQQEHHSLTVSDFQFKKDDFGNELVMFVEGITRTRQSCLHEKHRLIQPKIFPTDTSRCLVNVFKLYLSKRPSQLRSSGPLYLSIIHKPVSNSLWYKNVPMGQHTINFIKERMIEKSPLRNSDKKLTNHPARKTHTYKITYEIIGITGHNSEAGLDAYDSGNEEQQRAISNAIDTVNKDPLHFQQSNSKLWLLLNLRIITFITALLIFAMVRILFNTKIIIENVKNV